MGHNTLKTIIKTLLLFSLCVLVPVKISASSELENVTLQLHWKDQFEFAGFYAAKEKGFYKEAGLDVTFKPFTSDLDIIDEVLNDKAQYGVSYADIVFRYFNGDPLVFVANFFKHSPLVLVAQKEFSLPSDLKDKKIMGVSTQLNGATLLMMFKKFDMHKGSYQNVPPSFNIGDFINKTVDAMTVFTTNETYFLDKAGVEYNVLNPAAYGVPFYDLNLFTTRKELQEHPARVERFRAATIKGWKYALSHKDEIIKLIQTKYNSQEKSYDSLQYEANQIEHIMLPSIHPIGSVNRDRVKLIAENLVELGMIPATTSLNTDAFIYRNTPKNLKLTKNEMYYLQRKKEITYCVDPHWMPLSKIKNNTHIGMDADYIAYLSSKLNISFKLIHSKTWLDAMEKAEREVCDILTLAVPTQKRKQHFAFTETLFSTPLVLATQIDQNFINNISKIKNQSIGMVKDYAYIDQLTFQYPLMDFVEVNTINEGLKKVADGELYGLVGNLTTIGYLIQQNYIGTLKVSSKLHIDLNLGYAVKKENTLLLSILNKAIDTLDEGTKESIMNRWTNVKYAEGMEYGLLNKMLLFLLIILLAVWYRYRTIKRDNTKLQELSTKDSLSKLYNRRYIDKLIYDKQIDVLDEKRFCLILVDIDNFKKINDTYGHEHGDKSIVKFSELLQKNVRAEDTVSRWGGEEFLIICPHTNIEEAAYLAERIRRAVENTSFDTTWQVTASIGVAQYSDPESKSESYIKKVDDALAEAKQTGKNKVIVND